MAEILAFPTVSLAALAAVEVPGPSLVDLAAEAFRALEVGTVVRDEKPFVFSVEMPDENWLGATICIWPRQDVLLYFADGTCMSFRPAHFAAMIQDPLQWLREARSLGPDLSMVLDRFSVWYDPDKDRT